MPERQQQATHRTEVRLPQALFEDLRELAVEEHRSLNQEIVAAIEFWVRRGFRNMGEGKHCPERAKPGQGSGTGQEGRPASGRGGS